MLIDFFTSVGRLVMKTSKMLTLRVGELTNEIKHSILSEEIGAQRE